MWHVGYISLLTLLDVAGLLRYPRVDGSIPPCCFVGGSGIHGIAIACWLSLDDRCHPGKVPDLSILRRKHPRSCRPRGGDGHDDLAITEARRERGLLAHTRVPLGAYGADAFRTTDARFVSYVLLICVEASV